MMPSLSVRKIEEKTLSLLRMQAARHGVSMEEEIRQIIRKSVSTPERPGDMAMRFRLFVAFAFEQRSGFDTAALHKDEDIGIK